jgi:hypothetical protein
MSAAERLIYLPTWKQTLSREVYMKFTITFQYRAPESPRPYDEEQEDRIKFEGSDTALIPNVGDAVIYKCGDENRAFKVESRTFSYMAIHSQGEVNYCNVNIVVTDISDDEIAARLKE